MDTTGLQLGQSLTQPLKQRDHGAVKPLFQDWLVIGFESDYLGEMAAVPAFDFRGNAILQKGSKYASNWLGKTSACLFSSPGQIAVTAIPGNKLADRRVLKDESINAGKNNTAQQ